MPILKSSEHVRAAHDAIVLDLGDLGEQARRLKEQAQAEADRIVQEARQKVADQADAAHESASERGFAEGKASGYEAGLEQGRAEAFDKTRGALQQLEQAWRTALEAFTDQRDDLDRQSRERVVTFALLVAERVTHRVLSVDRSVVVDQVAAALDLVLRANEVSVVIHPEDEPIVREALPTLLADCHRLRAIHLVTDEAVMRGGCVVRHGQGEIDAQIDTQLERIIEAVLPQRVDVAPDETSDEMTKPSDQGNEASPIADRESDADESDADQSDAEEA